MLKSLGQTLLINLLYSASSPSIDNWWAAPRRAGWAPCLRRCLPGWLRRARLPTAASQPTAASSCCADSCPPLLLSPNALACRGHMGGLVGGALVALLVGPQWRTRSLPGKRGTLLVDTAPLPWFRSEPREIR